jgi:hypothetical protein
MKKSIIIIASFFLLGFAESASEMKSEPTNIQEVIKEDYVLHKTQKEQGILLIVFPDLGGNAESTKESFNILSAAKEANISVLMMNFNHHLFLSKKDNFRITGILNEVVKLNNLSPEKVVIGGFSSGGIVSSLWSNYLLEINHAFKPQKTFAVDSPLDLVELFYNVTAVDSLSHNVSMEEANYIINYFEEALNTKDSLIQKIAEVSPFNYATFNFKNIERLKEVDFRIYTEPYSVWWKQNRGFDFEETDSYQVIRFAKSAKEFGWNNLQLIQTTDRGYRPDGNRHPHSWSIVNPNELIAWILKK